MRDYATRCDLCFYSEKHLCGYTGDGCTFFPRYPYGVRLLIGSLSGEIRGYFVSGEYYEEFRKGLMK